MRPIHKRFSRGYAFRNFEGQPQPQLIQAEIPPRVAIPLRQGFGDEVAPIVEIGQHVEAGQIIARDDESLSSPVHSSVNGTIVEIQRLDYLGQGTGLIVIESHGVPGWQAMQGHSAKWKDLSPEKIGELIYLSGASSAGSAGIPTAFNSSVISPQEVQDVIVQGIACEVHNPSLDVLVPAERLGHLVDGLRILKKLMPQARFHLVLDQLQKSLIKKLSETLPPEDWINFLTVPAKYPVSHDEVLAPLVLGRDVPPGSSATDIGAIVLDIQDVLHVYEAVTEGKALIERTIALCGPGFSERPHVKVRVGSSLAHVIDGKTNSTGKYRLVLNSSMTGHVLDDASAPIDRTFTSVVSLLEDDEREMLSFVGPGFRKDSYSGTCISTLLEKVGNAFPKKCGTNTHGERRPCIYCSYCEELCPVALIPNLLFQRVERDMIDEELLKYEIYKCIECNLCDYICPSKIPLAGYISKGKGRLIEEGVQTAACQAAPGDSDGGNHDSLAVEV